MEAGTDIPLLILGNSFSQIKHIPIDQHEALREKLSYKITPGANKYGAQSYKKYLMDKKGNFPSGLLEDVKDFLTFNRIRYTQSVSWVKPKPQGKLFNLALPFTPYPEQIEIAEASETYTRGTVSACTGFGKSVSIALLINNLQLRTLIVVPNLELKRQLTEDFTNYFGKESLKSNIKIENIDSRALNKAKDYDVLIIDEAHHSAAKTYRTLNAKVWPNIHHRYFFTATPFRSDDEEQILLKSIAGEVIYEVSYKKAVAKGYIVPVEAYYVEVPKTKILGNTWAQVYSEVVVNKEVRNKIIAELLLKIHANNQSTLCLVKEIKHGENIGKLLDVAFAHGVNPETSDLIKWFSKGQLKTLVATTGIMAEGVDSKACEYVIIAGLGKSRPNFMQSVGRGVRRFEGKISCKVIIFLDRSHRWTKEHYKAQVLTLKEYYGIEPLEIKVDIV